MFWWNEINYKLLLLLFVILSNFDVRDYQNIDKKNMMVNGKKHFDFEKILNRDYQNNFQLLPSNRLFMKSQPSQMSKERTQHVNKRFLSSDTKYLMRKVSVASNSEIHDNYVSQQLKWSNR